MSTPDADSKPFDPFELMAAILLGLGAIAASVAGHQEGLWGGASVEAYGEAAALTTKASSTYNDELTTYMQDTQTDVRAKELIWEGDEMEDAEAGKRKLGMASWMLLTQLSEPAYAALKLPEATRKAYEGGDAEMMLTNDELVGALNIDLDGDYVDSVFVASSEEIEGADKRFAEGRTANGNGDQFSLAGVIFTVALFFAGLSLIFKTSMRWAFLGVGTLVLISATVFMSTLTWA